MLQNYASIRPGIRINQHLISSSLAAAEEVVVACVGPKYALSRYGRETTPGTAFSTTGATLDYSRIIEDVTEALDLELFAVDLASVRVHGVNLEADLATFTAAGNPSFKVPVLSAPNEIKLTSGAVKGTSLATGFRERDCQVGDAVVVTPTNGATPFKRKITGFRGVRSNGSFGSNAAASNSHAGNNGSNPIDSTSEAVQISAPSGWSVTCDDSSLFKSLSRGGKLANKYGEEFIITVHTPGAPTTATVNITTASGAYAATDVATVDSAGNFSITDANAGGELAGVDLTLVKPSGGSLQAGMSFRIQVIGDYERLSTSQVVAGGSYAGTFDTTYTATVISPGNSDTVLTNAVIEIADTSGREPVEQVTITENTAFDVGSFGLTLKFVGSGNMPTHGNLRAGDVYYISAKAGVTSTTSFDTVILDGPVVDTTTWTDAAVELYSVNFRLPYTGAIAADAAAGGLAWTATADGLDVESNLALQITTRGTGYEWCPFINTVGELHVSFRAVELVADGAHGFQMVSDSASLLSYAGPADADNPLGAAAQWQLIGTEGRPIYILNTGGTTAADYATALAAVQHSTLSYEFLCVNSASDIIAAVQAHVASASSAALNTQRRARFAIESPGKYTILEKQVDTSNYTATVAPYGGGNKLVVISSGSSTAALLSRGITSGYLAVINGVEYPIDRVISDTEFLLSTGPDSAVSPAVAIKITASDTVASQKSWLKTMAEGIKDRRITLCWAERPFGSDGAILPVLFGAAHVSGLRGALPPSVGLTRQSVAPFAGTRMQRYTEADLNDIAASGITILTQDNQTLPVRVRHQLTTNSTDILNIEESTTVRLDVLSKRLFVAFDALLGKVNTSDRTVELIRAEALKILTGAREVPAINSTFGPLIDEFSNLVVAKDANIASRINVRCTIAIGPPLNRVEVTLDTYAELPATA